MYVCRYVGMYVCIYACMYVCMYVVDMYVKATRPFLLILPFVLIGVNLAQINCKMWDWRRQGQSSRASAFASSFSPATVCSSSSAPSVGVLSRSGSRVEKQVDDVILQQFRDL